MASGILSKNIDFLRRLIGQSITQVSRQIFIGDLDLNNFEEMADGPTQLIFDCNTIVSFYAMTEENSLEIRDEPMPQYGGSYSYIEVTNNQFWKTRVNRKVQNIEILKSKYFSIDNPSEFAIAIKMENNREICVEYLNEKNFPDTVRVIEKYLGSSYIRTSIL